MKKNQILIAAGIVILLILGGIWCWNGQEQEEVSTSESVVEGGNENSGICEDDISKWQTYTNEKYGFEVKYPGGEVTEEDEKIEFSEGIVERVVVSEIKGDGDSIVERAIDEGGRIGTGMLEDAYYVDDFLITNVYGRSGDKIEEGEKYGRGEKPTRRAVILYVHSRGDRRDRVVIEEQDSDGLYQYNRPRYTYDIYFAPTMEAHGYATEAGIKKLISFAD